MELRKDFISLIYKLNIVIKLRAQTYTKKWFVVYVNFKTLKGIEDRIFRLKNKKKSGLEARSKRLFQSVSFQERFNARFASHKVDEHLHGGF